MTDFLALVRDLRLYLVAVLVSGDWYHRLPYLKGRYNEASARELDAAAHLDLVRIRLQRAETALRSARGERRPFRRRS
jgi:hypothetical protein